MCIRDSSSAIISLIALGSVVSVREGTIIAAVGIGKMVGVFEKLFSKRKSEMPNGESVISPTVEMEELPVAAEEL